MNKKIIFLILTFIPAFSQARLFVNFDQDFDQDIAKLMEQANNLQKNLSSVFSENLDNLNIYKNEKNGRCGLEISLPGFKKEEIKVEISNGILSLTAMSKKEQTIKKNDNNLNQDKKHHKKDDKQDKTGKVYVYKSISFQSKNYARKFKLPEFVDYSDSKEIKSTYENGILKIDFPLKTDNSNKNSIKVEVK